jgi:hypothetical protein
MTVALLTVGAVTAVQASACTPHLDTQGPTLTVSPNYSDPSKSDYSYDFTGTHVGAVTCL